VKAYERVGERRWNLILDDGVIVKLPETNWTKELDALEHLIIDKGILERDVSEIDLRSPAQYFFVLKSGEKKNEPRGNAA
jgi:cell division protein FtsQ